MKCFIVPLLLASAIGWSVALSQVATGFVKRNGNRLELNGKPYRTTGANSYDLALNGELSAEYMKRLARMGVNIIRTWMFNEGTYRPFQTFGPDGKQTFHEEALLRVDRLLVEAAKNDIKLVLCFANNWKDYGGVAAYNTAFGLEYHEDFFSMEKPKAAYKAWVQKVLTRKNSLTGVLYSEDPAIMMWELINEPKCHGDVFKVRNGPGSCLKDKTIISWTKEMAAFVKSLDKNHLLSLGSAGSLDKKYLPADMKEMSYEGVATADVLSIKDLDVAAPHIYTEQSDPASVAKEGDAYIIGYGKACLEAGVPVILGEYFPVVNHGNNNGKSGFDSDDINAMKIIAHWMYFARISNFQATLLWNIAPKPGVKTDMSAYVISTDDPRFQRLLIHHGKLMKGLLEGSK